MILQAAVTVNMFFAREKHREILYLKMMQLGFSIFGVRDFALFILY